LRNDVLLNQEFQDSQPWDNDKTKDHKAQEEWSKQFQKDVSIQNLHAGWIKAEKRHTDVLWRDSSTGFLVIAPESLLE
jgi:hypothetical protein